jgi:hypothetical protein
MENINEIRSYFRRYQVNWQRYGGNLECYQPSTQWQLSTFIDPHSIASLNGSEVLCSPPPPASFIDRVSPQDHLETQCHRRCELISLSGCKFMVTVGNLRHFIFHEQAYTADIVDSGAAHGD